MSGIRKRRLTWRGRVARMDYKRLSARALYAKWKEHVVESDYMLDFLSVCVSVNLSVCLSTCLSI